MSDDKNLIDELVLKRKRGEQLTTAEIRMLEDRLRQMPVVPSDEIWDQLRQRTGMGSGQAPVAKSRLQRPLMAAAAVILLLFAIGIPLLQQKRTANQVVADGERLVVDSNGHAGPLALQLPDGSKVVLCYGSRLSYIDGFRRATRDIYLEGQAAFKVAENAAKPFLVHFNQAEVRVLGTEFNVMAYADVPAEITLLSGKVQVAQGQMRRVLKPSQQIIVNKDNMPVRTLSAPGQSIGWAQKDAYFGFDSTKLTTVLQRFAHWYHVIVFNPYHVKGEAITGIFRQQTSLDSNLLQLGDAERQSARLERRNDTIFLLPYVPAPIKYPNH